MKKILFWLPAFVICLIYGFILLILEGSFEAAVDMVQNVVVLYIALPVIGSVLLSRGKWWGSIFGIAMGLLLIYNHLQYSGHQHVNVDVPLGIVFAVYYLVMGILCALPKRRV